jgi:hypothetical protein
MHLGLELLKNLFLKDIIKKIFSFKLIKDLSKTLAYICALALFYYLFKLEGYKNAGSGHFRYSGFISSKMKPKIDDAIDELFKSRLKPNAYLFISLVEVHFPTDQCKYRWKYIRGFNEGTKKTYKDIVESREIYDDKMLWTCSYFDKKERLQILSNSRNKVDVKNDNSSLLYTQKEFIDNDMSNYKINYLTYFLKPYESNSEFYIIQVASRKPLKEIIVFDTFDSKFEDLIQELQSITKPKKWYEIFDR